MRKLNILSGTVLLVLSAGMATAGPLERDATSKALGDMQGRGIARQGNRVYSYAPASDAAAPTIAEEQPQAAAPATPEQDNSARSFSLEAAPSDNAVQMNRRVRRTPGFLRADRKALGEY